MKFSSPPAVWWMTDETRVTDPAAALARIPRGSGVILRHYAAPERAALAAKLAERCRALGLRLLVASDWRLAARVRAAGLHLPEALAWRGPAPGARLWLMHRGRILTAAAHGRRGLARGRAIGADAVLLSPVFPTRSHPCAKALGLARAALMVKVVGMAVIALGGVKPRQTRVLKRRGFTGIAGVGFGL